MKKSLAILKWIGYGIVALSLGIGAYMIYMYVRGLLGIAGKAVTGVKTLAKAPVTSVQAGASIVKDIRTKGLYAAAAGWGASLVQWFKS